MAAKWPKTILGLIRPFREIVRRFKPKPIQPKIIKAESMSAFSGLIHSLAMRICGKSNHEQIQKTWKEIKAMAAAKSLALFGYDGRMIEKNSLKSMKTSKAKIQGEIAPDKTPKNSAIIRTEKSNP